MGKGGVGRGREGWGRVGEGGEGCGRVEGVGSKLVAVFHLEDDAPRLEREHTPKAQTLLTTPTTSNRI